MCCLSDLLMSRRLAVRRGLPLVAASMFRFDGLIIAMGIINSNTYCYYLIAISIKWLIAKGIYFCKRCVLCSKKHREGMCMERDELADDRMAFMAGEVGCVVFELI